MTCVRGTFVCVPSIFGLDCPSGSRLVAREFLLEYLSVSSGFLAEDCLGSTCTKTVGIFFVFCGGGLEFWRSGLGRGFMKSKVSWCFWSNFSANMILGSRTPDQTTAPHTRRCTASDIATVHVRRYRVKVLCSRLGSLFSIPQAMLMQIPGVGNLLFIV